VRGKKISKTETSKDGAANWRNRQKDGIKLLCANKDCDAARWLTATPFGTPEDPEVYITYESSSGLASRGVSLEARFLSGIAGNSSTIMTVGPFSQVAISLNPRVVIMRVAETSLTTNLTRSLGASRLIGQKAPPEFRIAS
jgi:hypothetical protein